MQRKLNLVFLACFLGVTTAAAAIAYLVHRWQVQRNLGAVLDRAGKTEAAGELDKSINYLRSYLSLKPLDGDVWARLAGVMDRKTPKEPGRLHPGRPRVYEALAQATRLKPDDAAIRRQCIAVALELRRFSEARRHILVLYDPIKDTAGDSGAELEDLLGQCDQGENNPFQAREYYSKAIKHDPGLVDAEDRLARLLRDNADELLSKPGDPDEVVKKMVDANPRSARAYLNRWLYYRKYGPPADDQDISRALERDPDDVDVLVAAAELKAERGQLGEARRLIEHGLKLHPKKAAFYLLSASLENRDNQPEKAERILRQGIEAIPGSAELPFFLTDLLITQDRLDGPDGAVMWLDRLSEQSISDGAAKYLEARLEVARQRWKEAIAKLNTARTLLASDPAVGDRLKLFLGGRINLMLAKCLLLTGDEEGRLEALKRATESPVHSDAVSAQLELAEGLEAAGQFAEAESQFELVANSRPEARLDAARVVIKKTNCLPRSKQHWEEAEQRVKDAERAVPRDTVGLALLKADLLEARQQLDQARQVLEAARKASPKDLRPWAGLSRIVQLQGQWPQALEILDQADKELGPRLELTSARLSAWSRRGGDEARSALARLAEAITRFSADDRLRLRDELAKAWLRLGETKRARATWRELLALQPGNLRVMSILEDVAVEAGDHTEARELMARLRELEGEEGMRWRFAEVAILIDQARRGDRKALETAQPLVSEIFARHPDWWGVAVLRAEVAEVQGRLDDAVRYYEDAIRMGNTPPSVPRRLITILDQLQRFDQINALVDTLAIRGLETEELSLATALAALRKGDFARAVAVARQTLPETSKSPNDHLALGRILLAAGQTEEAGRELKLAVDLGPGLPGTWLSYVGYLVQAKQTDKARSAIEEARKALPAALAAPTLAQCHAMVGDVKEAEAYYQAALAALPDNPAILRLAAEFYLAQHKRARAEPLLTTLLDPATGALPDDLAWARRTRGLLQIGTSSSAGTNEAIKATEENLRVNPYSVDDQRTRSMLLATQPSRRSEAIRDLLSRDRITPLDDEQRFLLALLYFAEGNRAKCQTQLLKLLGDGATPRDPNHLVLMIRVQLDQDNLKEADRWLAELKSAEPRSSRSVELEATLLKAQKRDSELLALLRAYGSEPGVPKGTAAALFDRFGFPDDAERAYREAVAGNPKEPERIGRLIEFLGRRNQTEQALDLWGQTRQELPLQLAAGVGASVVSLPSATEAQREKVASWLAEVLTAQPGNVPLRLKLAFVRLRQDRRDEAQSLYRQVLADWPENVEALNNLASLLAFQDGSKDEALKMIDKAVALGGNLPALLDTRGVVHLQTGQPNRAVADLRQALAARAKFPVAYFHLARAYHQTKNRAEAKKAFEQSERMGLKREDIDPVERDEYGRLRQLLMKD
jgi:tetratricopeptide (TPR) repeat protein